MRYIAWIVAAALPAAAVLIGMVREAPAAERSPEPGRPPGWAAAVEPRAFRDPPRWHLGASPVFIGMWNGDLNVKSLSESVPALGASFKATPRALDAINGRNFDLQVVGAKLDVRLGLPALALPLGSLHPSIEAGAGGVSFRQDIGIGPVLAGGPLQRYQYVGSGFFGSAGAALAWAAGPYFLRAAGSGEFIPEADTGNSEHIAGASADFAYRRAAVEGTLGRSFLDRQVGIYLGVAHSWTWVDIEEVRPFTPAPGTVIRRSFDLEATRTQGIAGFDFQWVPGRFGGNFEWRFNAQDRFARLEITFLF